MFYTDGVYAVLWDVTSHKSVTANILGGPTVFIFREEENGSRRFLLKIINITTKVRGVISQNALSLTLKAVRTSEFAPVA
jgi:hypothetical protein